MKIMFSETKNGQYGELFFYASRYLQLKRRVCLCQLKVYKSKQKWLLFWLPFSFAQQKTPENQGFREQITGIEPASPAWEASVLPMNYICALFVYYSTRTPEIKSCRMLFLAKTDTLCYYIIYLKKADLLFIPCFTKVKKTEVCHVFACTLIFS